MFSLGPEQHPSFGLSLAVRKATASDPIQLYGIVSQDYLTDLDLAALQVTGLSIHELAEDQPRDAYVRLSGLFSGRFIDPKDSDWGIGSAEEDGPQAFDGLTRYLEEERAPDPDVEEIDVIIAVWKSGSLFNRLRGKKPIPEEVLRFRVEPQGLAAY